MMKRLCLTLPFALAINALFAQGGPTPEGCSATWIYTAYSECRGFEMITSADVNGDGKTEVFAGAGSPDGAYWYMLEYLPDEGIYWPTHISEDLGFFGVLKAIDPSGQGDWRILVPLSTGEVKQYDGGSLAPLPSLFLPNTGNTATNIFQLDTDGDGEEEIIFVTYDYLYIYDAAFNLELSYPFEEGALNTAIANIDDDSSLEIIRENGQVLNLATDYSITPQWIFPDGGGGNSFVYAGDVDGDGRNEIVHASIDKVRVYDAELQSLQFEITVDNSFGWAHPVLLADVNGNGRQEIITYYLANFNDGDGGIACYDALTQDTLWTIIGDFRGARSMHIADTDNDGEPEIAWWDGCLAAGGGRLHIAGLESHIMEYILPKNEGRAYLALDIGDVDLDNEPEILLAPQIGIDNPQGLLELGLLYAVDAKTHAFEWSNRLNGGPFFPSSAFITALKIARLEDGGEEEILVGTDSSQVAVIYRLAPATFEIKQRYVLDLGMSVADMAIDDVDGDGQKEMIVLTTYENSFSTGNYLFVIDPVTGEREWVAPGMGFRVFNSTAVRVGNIDQDDAMEIVLAKDSIIVYDAITHEKQFIRNNTINDFSALDLYDFDGDGAMEVITGLGTRALILDGAAFAPTDTITIPGLPSQKEINAIRVADLNQNGLPEIVISDQNQLFYATPAGRVIEGPRLGNAASQANRLLVSNLDEDAQQELLAINNYAVLQLETNCVECLYFGLDIEVQQPTCLPNSGAVAALLSGLEGQSFSYLWSTGDTTATLTGLSPGTYSVTVNSSGGCQVEGQVELREPQIRVEVSSSPTGCDSLGTGSLVAEVVEGLPPFQFNWSNGDTTSIADGLSAGLYSLTVADANTCIFTDTFLIEATQLSGFFSLIRPVSCNGEATGAVRAIPLGGIGPYQYNWSTSDSTNLVENLFAGRYYLTVQDSSSGCIWQDSVEIQAATLAIEASAILPACNGAPFGWGQVEVLEGAPPFTYQWAPGVITSNNAFFNAPPGANTVIVTDFWGCMAADTYFIATHELDFELLATQVSSPGSADGSLEVQVTTGTPPYAYEWSTGANTPSITGLGPGAYSVTVTDSTSCFLAREATLPEPPVISIEITGIIPDDPATPEPEGMATIAVNGGTPPYTILWKDAAGNPVDPGLGLFSGTYTVAVIDANNYEASVEITIPILSGAKEQATLYHIRLYPNPTEGQLTLETTVPLTGHFRLQLFGQLGQLVWQTAGNLFSDKKLEQDFSEMPGGTYFLRLSTAAGAQIWRVEVVK